MQYEGLEPETDDKYLVSNTLQGFHAAEHLREQGYEAVFSRADTPEIVAQGAVQEDVSHVLLDGYDVDEIADVIDGLEQYGADDITLLGAGEDGWYEVPTDWEDVTGVGKKTYNILEDTELVPWAIDEQVLTQELDKAYGVGKKNELTTKIRNQNPYLFD